MPRLVSMVIPGHEFAPPAVFHASLGHVSEPDSPGCGMVGNVQRSLPVRMSYARTCPGAAPSLSLTRLPWMSRSSNTTPGLVATMNLSHEGHVESDGGLRCETPRRRDPPRV